MPGVPKKDYQFERRCLHGLWEIESNFNILCLALPRYLGRTFSKVFSSFESTTAVLACVSLNPWLAPSSPAILHYFIQTHEASQPNPHYTSLATLVVQALLLLA